MPSRQLRSLVTLNLLLLAVLAAVSFGPAALAQPTPEKTRSSGDYTMVSGRAQGHTESVVYIVDAVNRDVVAIKWDRSRKTWQGLGYANLVEDAATGARRTR